MTSSGELSPSSSVASSQTNGGLGPAAPKYGTVIPNRIFVGGISGNTSEAELKAFFSAYGPVKDAKIIADRAGVSKGYGFVTFETQDDAEKIIKKEADNLIFKDRKLNIGPAVRKQQAFPRPDAPFSPVMFSNGIPYTFQNGMAIFHGGQDPTSAYHALTQPQHHTQPSYQTVMAAATVPPHVYLSQQTAAQQYQQTAAAAYQSAAVQAVAQAQAQAVQAQAAQAQTTPHWTTAAQWRWPAQCATPAGLATSPASGGYMYAPSVQHLTPEMMYAAATGAPAQQATTYASAADLSEALLDSHGESSSANSTTIIPVSDSIHPSARSVSEISFVDMQGSSVSAPPGMIHIQTPVSSKQVTYSNYYSSPQVTPSPRKHYSTPMATMRGAKAPRLVSKIVNGTTINVVDGLMPTQLLDQEFDYAQPLTPPPTPQQLHRK